MGSIKSLLFYYFYILSRIMTNKEFQSVFLLDNVNVAKRAMWNHVFLILFSGETSRVAAKCAFLHYGHKCLSNMPRWHIGLTREDKNGRDLLSRGLHLGRGPAWQTSQTGKHIILTNNAGKHGSKRILNHITRTPETTEMAQVTKMRLIVKFCKEMILFI
jgi:hypothetical protein